MFSSATVSSLKDWTVCLCSSFWTFLLRSNVLHSAHGCQPPGKGEWFSSCKTAPTIPCPLLRHQYIIWVRFHCSIYYYIVYTISIIQSCKTAPTIPCPLLRNQYIIWVRFHYSIYYYIVYTISIYYYIVYTISIIQSCKTAPITPCPLLRDQCKISYKLYHIKVSYTYKAVIFPPPLAYSLFLCYQWKISYT